MPALRRLELALQRLFTPPRQFWRDLVLRPAQDKRTQRPRQPFHVGVTAGSRRAHSLKRFRRSEQTRIQELEQTPQFPKMILDWRATQRQSVASAEQSRGFR